MLYLNINRDCSSSVASSATAAAVDIYAPYRQVAEEILHWACGSDRSTYQLMIDEQIKAAQFVAKWRKAKKFSPKTETVDAIGDNVEFRTIHSLISSNEVALDLSTEEATNAWQRLCEIYQLPSRINQSSGKSKRARSPSLTAPKFWSAHSMSYIYFDI